MIQVSLEQMGKGYRLCCSGHAVEGSNKENTAVCAAASMLYYLVGAIANANGGCIDASTGKYSIIDFTADSAREAAQIGACLLRESYPNMIVLQGLLPP